MSSSRTEIHYDPAGLAAAAARFREPTHVVRHAGGHVGVALGDLTAIGGEHTPIGTLAPLYPEWLGDRAFTELHGVRFPYVVGEMANGIASVAMVQAAARTGTLGMFGAAGLSPDRVESALRELRDSIGAAGLPWGSNLIHSPSEPSLEEAIVDLYLRYDVTRVSASAYMSLTPAIVRYALAGIRRDPTGRVVRRNHVIAKVSRPEVAERFLSPAPAAMVEALRSSGRITAEEAACAPLVPLAEDLTAEADSGGHTDNRPLASLLPVLCRLRDELSARHNYARAIRVGAAGGLGTPEAVAGAFAMGAAYVLTGSVNQATREAGISDAARRMLAQADLADVIMAPAADMFEMGVHVQVLRRGSMFAARAKKLWDLYRAYPSIEELPPAERERLEREILRSTVDEAWRTTAEFWQRREPAQVERAAVDPRHRMALIFRSYLGLSSRWAIAGVPERELDFQIWCGPAMGAFNRWVRGTPLEPVEARTVSQIALNLLEGAAQVTRAQQLRTFGIAMPAAAFAPAARLFG